MLLFRFNDFISDVSHSIIALGHETVGLGDRLYCAWCFIRGALIGLSVVTVGLRLPGIQVFFGQIWTQSTSCTVSRLSTLATSSSQLNAPPTPRENRHSVEDEVVALTTTVVATSVNRDLSCSRWIVAFFIDCSSLCALNRMQF